MALRDTWDDGRSHRWQISHPPPFKGGVNIQRGNRSCYQYGGGGTTSMYGIIGGCAQDGRGLYKSLSQPCSIGIGLVFIGGRLQLIDYRGESSGIKCICIDLRDIVSRRSHDTKDLTDIDGRFQRQHGPAAKKVPSQPGNCTRQRLGSVPRFVYATPGSIGHFVQHKLKLSIACPKSSLLRVPCKEMLLHGGIPTLRPLLMKLGPAMPMGTMKKIEDDDRQYCSRGEIKKLELTMWILRHGAFQEGLPKMEGKEQQQTGYQAGNACRLRQKVLPVDNAAAKPGQPMSSTALRPALDENYHRNPKRRQVKGETNLKMVPVVVVQEFPEVFPGTCRLRRDEGTSGATARTYGQRLHKTKFLALGAPVLFVKKKDRRLTGRVHRLQKELTSTDSEEPRPTPKDR
ncbi:hypothetical protein Tco_1352125 [Tanacetum coccineum]|uniref:Uncharacterized protein n=1 Tax=Tanacetum coccineum TaxID=301880 RepID=A0ABQ5FJU9_9ASTR